MTPRQRSVASLVLLALLAAGCQTDPRKESVNDRQKTNVVLVSIDTLRADHVGIYGRTNAETKTLDRLAEEGTRFTNAIAPTPLTLPSHTTLFTGLYPPRHGVRHNGLFRLDPSIPTLARRLGETGYDTAAFVAAFVLNRQYGLAQGFAHYDDQMSEHKSSSAGPAERSADVVTTRALDWLRKTEEPFFLFVHYYDPHANYAPPAPFDERFRDHPYDGEIAYVDHQLSRLTDALRELGHADNTLVVITSDHGEGFGEHGEVTHSYTLYDETLRVPLIVNGPGIPRDTVVDDVVSLVDVAPTVLAQLGLPPLADVDGRDLATLWQPGVDEPRNAYAETMATRLDHGWSSLHGLRSRRYFYVQAPRPELYDLTVDPDEADNLLAEEANAAGAIAAPFDKEVREHLARSNDQARLDLDEGTQERLRALGYNVTNEPVAESGMDPKDGIVWLDKLVKIHNAIEQREYAATKPDAELLVENQPESAWAHWLLAEILYAEGDQDVAMQHVETAIALSPRYAKFHVLHGRVCEALGDPTRAEAAYAKAIELEPTEPRARLRSMNLAALRGDFPTTRTHADALIAADPTEVRRKINVAEVWITFDQYPRARALLTDALRIDPNAKAAHAAMWVIETRAGNPDAANTHKRRAEDLADNPGIRRHVAVALARRGDIAAAESILVDILEKHPDQRKARLLLVELQNKGKNGG